MCQLAALFSELLMLCGSVDQKVIFATLFICHLLRASAAYFDSMYVIVVCCQALVLNDGLYLSMWAIVRGYLLFSAVFIVIMSYL